MYGEKLSVEPPFAVSLNDNLEALLFEIQNLNFINGMRQEAILRNEVFDQNVLGLLIICFFNCCSYKTNNMKTFFKIIH